ncbi:MAG: hypothetical protein BWY76_01576 [bacterium ADurb.Bin429]|nr:MAG: hypothetical protein BWY76_01576 [bacterium ADurb.Bin429]
MRMVVGIATIELEVTDALTLKDKRQVLRSLLQRIKNNFNVSAAEVGHLQAHTLTTIGLAAVANDKAYVHGMLEKIVDMIEREPRVLLLGYETELV